MIFEIKKMLMIIIFSLLLIIFVIYLLKIIQKQIYRTRGIKITKCTTSEALQLFGEFLKNPNNTVGHGN